MQTRNTSEKKKPLDIKDENFEEHILDISIKKPTRAYNFYLKEMKETKNNSDNNITSISREFSNKWATLSENEKKKYQDMEKEDVERFNHHLSLVKKHLLEKPLKETATAFNIFVDEYVKKAIQDEEKDPKKARLEAKEAWKNLSEDQINVYEEKKEKHKELYESMKRANGRVSGYTLFVKDELMQAKEQNIRMTLADCAEKWNKSKQSIKDNYQIYADQIREDRERLKDIYEITYGIKPKRPVGAYKFFMMESAKEGAFDGKNPFKEAAKMWAKLTDQKKERYQKIAKKKQLIYILKKSEYLASIRKSGGKSSSALNLYIADQKHKIEGELPAGGMFEYCYNKWLKESEEVKSKYAKKAEIEKAKFESNRKKEEFEAPKKPTTPYANFYKEQYSKVKEKHPELETKEIMKLVGTEWTNMDQKEKVKYMDRYKEEIKKYKEDLKEYESKINSSANLESDKKKSQENNSNIVKSAVKTSEKPKETKTETTAKKSTTNKSKKPAENEGKSTNKKGKK